MREHLEVLISLCCPHIVVLSHGCLQTVMFQYYNDSCWPSPSNQSFYRQIAGYGMGVGDHRVG